MSLPLVSLKTLNELGYQKNEGWEASFHKGIHIRKVDSSDCEKPRYEVLIQLDKRRGQEHGWIKMHTSNEAVVSNIDVNLLKEMAYAVFKRFKTSQGNDNLQRLGQITAQGGSLLARIQKNSMGKVSITTNDLTEHEFETRHNARVKSKLEKEGANVQNAVIEAYKDEKLQRVRDRIFGENAAAIEKEEVEKADAGTMPLLPPKLDKEDRIATSPSRFGKGYLQSIQDTFRAAGRYLQDGAVALNNLTTIKINSPQKPENKNDTSASIFSYKAVTYDAINNLLQKDKTSSFSGTKAVGRALVRTAWAGAIGLYKIPLGVAKMLTTTTLSLDWNKLQTARYSLEATKLDKAKAYARFAFRSMPLSFIARQIPKYAKDLVLGPIQIVKETKKDWGKAYTTKDKALTLAFAAIRIALKTTPLSMARPVLKHVTRTLIAPILEPLTKHFAHLNKGHWEKYIFGTMNTNFTFEQAEKQNNKRKTAEANAQSAKNAYFASKNHTPSSGVRES